MRLPSSPLALGLRAEAPPALAVPVEALASLLRHRPERAALFLAQLPAPTYAAQLCTHTAACAAPLPRIAQEWRELQRHILLRPPPAPDNLLGASVYEPELLADLLAESPQQARRLLAALSPPQRLTQALAQAAWLARHGLPVSHQEILEGWEATPAT